MDIFGIGIPELLFLAILVLILLGPEELAANSRKAGVFLRKIIQSPIWRDVQGTSREIRELPTKLIREAGLEELKKETLDPASIDPRSWLAEPSDSEAGQKPAEQAVEPPSEQTQQGNPHE